MDGLDPTSQFVAGRLAKRLLFSFGFALVIPFEQGLAQTLTLLLVISSVFCTGAALLLRERVDGPVLTHWDEVFVLLWISSLAAGLGS